LKLLLRMPRENEDLIVLSLCKAGDFSFNCLNISYKREADDSSRLTLNSLPKPVIDVVISLKKIEKSKASLNVYLVDTPIMQILTPLKTFLIVGYTTIMLPIK